MSINYDLTDLLNNMIELEITGAEFYTTQAQRLKHPLLSPLLQQLAEQEERHRVTYENLRDGIGELPAVDQEYRDYLREIIDNRFNLSPEAIESCETVVDVIDFGIGLEKDSLRFIEAFARIAGAEHHAVTARIAEEETMHLRKLQEMRAKVG